MKILERRPYRIDIGWPGIAIDGAGAETARAAHVASRPPPSFRAKRAEDDLISRSGPIVLIGEAKGREKLGVAIVSAPERATELDGLRGWAAVSVVLFHLVSETFGAIFPVLRHPLIAMFLNGNLAVCVFFILSGEALSVGFMRSRNGRQAVSMMLKRYTRLTVPIFLSCLIVFALYKAHLTFNVPAGQLVKRGDWLGSFLSENISLKSFVQYVFVNVYSEVPLKQAFNPFLWTMRVELIGSVLVIFMLLSWHWVKNKLWLFLLSGIFLQITVTTGYISLFFIGMYFAWLRIERPAAAPLILSSGIVPIVLIFLLLGCIPLLNHVGTAPFRIEQVFAPILVFLVLRNRWPIAFLRVPFSQFLGKISFSIYLIQFPVIISATSYMIVRLGAAQALTAFNCAIVIAASLVLCVIGAWLFLVIEKLAARIGEFMSNTFLHAVAETPPSPQDPHESLSAPDIPCSG